MRNRCPRWLVLAAFCGTFGAANASAVDFHGRVLDRESKQPLEKVVVQVFSILGLGPGGRRIVASGYTNAQGRFLVPIPKGTDTRNLSLIVTHDAGGVSETFVGNQGLLVTNFKDVMVMKNHPSPKDDNILYANTSRKKGSR